jgi:hypothetical protein
MSRRNEHLNPAVMPRHQITSDSSWRTWLAVRSGTGDQPAQSSEPSHWTLPQRAFWPVQRCHLPLLPAKLRGVETQMASNPHSRHPS